MFRNQIAAGLVALVLSLGFVAPVGAGSLEDDLAAASLPYSKGEWANALRLLRPLAEKGARIAQSNLGTMYKFGRGLPQDYLLAHTWFSLSAAQGCTMSEFSSAERNNLAYAPGHPGAQIEEAQKLAREWKPKSD
jgi:TPR repeat protein